MEAATGTIDGGMLGLRDGHCPSLWQFRARRKAHLCSVVGAVFNPIICVARASSSFCGIIVPQASAVLSQGWFKNVTGEN